MFFQNAMASRLAGDTPCPCAVPGWPGSFPSPPSALPCRALCRAGAAGQRFRQRVPSAVLQALKQSPEGSWEAPGMSRGSFRGPDGDKKRRMLRCELHPPVPTAPPGAGRRPALSTQRSAPSAQHPALQSPAVVHVASPHPHGLPAARISQQQNPGVWPRLGAVRGGLAVAMEARPAWSRQAAAQDGLKGKRGRNEPRKPRGEGFVGTGGRGFPPSRGGRQAPAAVLVADPTRKAAAQRDPAR